MSINSSPRFPATRRLISDVINRAQNVRHAMGSCFGMNQPLEQDTFNRSGDSDSQAETTLEEVNNSLELFNLFLASQINPEQTEKRAKAITKAIKANVKLFDQIDKALEQNNLTPAKAQRLQRKVEKRIDQQARKFNVNLDWVENVQEQTEPIFGFL